METNIKFARKILALVEGFHSSLLDMYLQTYSGR